MTNIKLFISTFISAFMLAFGVAVLVLMFFPVLVTSFTSLPDFTPKEPVTDSGPVNSDVANLIPIRQLYPPLTSIENVQEGNWIRIPSIEANVPIVISPSMQDDDVLKTLDKGAALYPNGVLPGRLGNTFISAHSTGEPWKGKYRFAFLKIDALEDGHIMHVDYNGARYTYRISRTEIIEPNPNTRITSDRPMPTITLMACWPLWSTSQRMLVHGELTNITKLTVQPS